MDARLKACYGSSNAIKLNEEIVSVAPNQNLLNGVKFNNTLFDRNSVKQSLVLSDSSSGKFGSPLSVNMEGDLHEDFDFNDTVLKFINEMLMEENMEEKNGMFQASAALEAAEKSFFDVLVDKDPCFPSDHPAPWGHIVESLEEIHVGDHRYHSGNSSSLSAPGWSSDLNDYESSHVQSVPVNLDSRSMSQSSYSSSSGSGNIMDGLVNSPESILSLSDTLSDSQSVMQFIKGFEEASKFLPIENGIFDDMQNKDLLVKELKRERENVVAQVEQKHESKSIPDGSRGKKNPYSKDPLLEDGRSNKQSAVFTESTVRSEMFDKVLLYSGRKAESVPCEAPQNGAPKRVQQKGQSKGSSGGKARGKKQGGKKDMVDLRTLLTLCAQSIATNDRRSATDLLKQIRKHSSATGDGMQRLAHYFSTGLEARMAGAGTQIYKELISMPTSAADILKGYHLYLDCCPFRKVSNFFANKTIMNTAENATRLHIIDFGILYGFQWPCLIKRLASRTGGPPKLRITGIDFPCPGFRPAQRVGETGRRLGNYAEEFGVPFEFNAIVAQKWETINIEDLKIERDETVVVYCGYRFRNLLDETVMVDSPRSIVLNLIKKINPDVFIHGIVNGAYNAPFFITRFREALFHFSSMFDMLEANVAREVQERMLLEKIIWGREAMNVIACEGGERIERPETYKQWQARNLRTGFRPLPLNREIMNMAKEKAKSNYHKDFVIDEDGNWLLQGWKGRIVYAISSWRPAY